MLRIIVSVQEDFNEETSEFAVAESVTLDLEHSLVSLSKWESRYEKPFLGEDSMTREQVIDYVRMMILGEVPPDDVLARLSDPEFEQINSYINAKMTATWFNEKHAPKGNREVITAEVIYYWMISLGIPFECQEWHLNRLLTLIKVCNYKNAPKNKMSKGDVLAQQRDLNRIRRQQLGSSG